ASEIQLMRYKNLLFYLISIGGSAILIWLLIREGAVLEIGKLSESTIKSEGETSPGANLWHNLVHPLSILILQIVTIIVVARVFSLLLKRIGQPTVIGEILAGILLGPSLLGWLSPELSAFLFPAASLGNLQFLSQIGLILFMFVIGLELDSRSLRGQTHAAVVISHVSIVFPFLLGVLLAMGTYREFAPANVPFSAYALFMGIAISITAFPVLARIVQERGLSQTPIGNIVITCAAADDVTAWCLLAVVIAMVKAGAIGSALISIALSIVYVLFMFYIIKPLMSRFAAYYSNREMLGRPQVALIFLLLLVSAWMTEVIGIHALFGAFIAGVIIPDGGNFKRIITEKIEDVALVLLLPLFFVFTGLRTQIGLLNEAHLWLTCLVVVATAVVGKLVGSASAARFVGLSWKDSLSIGVLMNARGLMELVVLNIAYDLGVLSNEIFAMLVIMALATTFMTGPALNLIEYLFPKRVETTPNQAIPRILMSFGRPEMGTSILKLSYLLTGPTKKNIEFTSMHISPQYDISPEDAQEFEQTSFAPTLETSKALNIPIKTYYTATEDITQEIVNYTEYYNPDVLIVGAAQSLFDSDLLGGKISKILSQTHCDTLVFNDRGLHHIRQILILYYDTSDNVALDYGFLLAKNQGAKLHILNPMNRDWQNFVPQDTHVSVSELKEKILNRDVMSRYDILIINKDKWRQLLDNNSQWIQYSPSLLIVKKGEIPNKLFTTEVMNQPASVG
ncbi:MAG: cation:proton antiporter, partial [Saprospiraceae bacterium]